jgi:hypothetical protein
MRLALLMITAAAWGAEAPATPAPGPAVPRNVLTNQGVVLLARAGYSEAFLIDLIHHKQTQFDVTAEGLAWLARQGLSERVVRAMVANENKEEQTAVVPALFTVTPPASSPPVPRQTVQTPVNVAVPVSMPTPGPSLASWYVRDWHRDRWFLIPNVPVLAAGTR